MSNTTARISIFYLNQDKLFQELSLVHQQFSWRNESRIICLWLEMTNEFSIDWGFYELSIIGRYVDWSDGTSVFLKIETITRWLPAARKQEAVNHLSYSLERTRTIFVAYYLMTLTMMPSGPHVLWKTMLNRRNPGWCYLYIIQTSIS